MLWAPWGRAAVRARRDICQACGPGGLSAGALSLQQRLSPLPHPTPRPSISRISPSFQTYSKTLPASPGLTVRVLCLPPTPGSVPPRELQTFPLCAVSPQED